MDLRAAAAVSLSREDLQYRVGDPSRSSLIDIGDEDSGGSLIGEDIEAVSVTGTNRENWTASCTAGGGGSDKSKALLDQKAQGN